MKNIFIIILCLLSVTLQAQTYPQNPVITSGAQTAPMSFPNPGATGSVYQRLGALQTLFIPTISGAPTNLIMKNIGLSALVYDSVGQVLYAFNPADSVFYPVGSAGPLACVNGIQNANGAITETGTRTFNISPYTYKINCSSYTNRDTTITIPATVDFPRFDAVVGNTSSQGLIVTGTESLQPTPPDLLSTQTLLGLIFVSGDTSFVIPISPDLDGRYRKLYINDSAFAKPSFFDSVFLSQMPLPNDPLVSPPTAPIVFRGWAWDSVAQEQVRTEFDVYLSQTLGNGTPNYSLIFKAKNTGKVPLTLNANGNAYFWNDIQMIGASGSGTSPTIFAPDTIDYKSSYAHSFRNFRGRPDSSDFIQIDGGAGAYAVPSVNVIKVRGDGNATILSLKNQGNLGLGTNSPSEFSQLDITSTGRGFLPPRMTTAQRDSMAHRVTSVTLTDGGSGYTLGFPTFSAGSSPVGGINAVVSTTTITGGVVQDLLIGQAGTGYALGTFPLTVNNTGTGGSGAAGTYTVTSGTIPFGMTIVNIDSVYCPMETWNGSRWINACDSSAGTFPVGITSITADAPLTGGTITTFGNIGLGTVPIANGGTNNASLSVTAGTIPYGDGTKLIGLATGTAKQALHPDGSGGYVWRDTVATPTPFALTDGNGTTANGTAVDLGGTVTADVNLNDNVDNTHTVFFGDLHPFSLIKFFPNQPVNFQGNTTFEAGVNMNTLPSSHNADDSMLVVNEATGDVGKRPIPSAGSGTVTNVSGTSNRITVSSPTTTPVIDISSSYVGQGSITTVGTLTSGTSGTGHTIAGVTMDVAGTDAAGDLYYRNGSGILTRVATGTAKQSLHPDGSGGYVWRDTAVVASPDTLHIDTTQLTITNDTLSLPYKTYAAIITLPGDGVTDPTVTVLQNNVGNIVWTVSSTGVYLGTLINAFTANKTVVNGVSMKTTYDNPGIGSPIVIDGPVSGYLHYTRQDIDVLKFVTTDTFGDTANLNVSSLFIEIRIYP